MAGDTHDLEYYAEERRGAVWPAGRASFRQRRGRRVPELRHRAGLAADARRRRAGRSTRARIRCARRSRPTSTLPKRPLWWWTDMLEAWPFSVEWLSAAFDFNVAPFYQSFIEVRVEPSARRVRAHPLRHLGASAMERLSGLGGFHAGRQWQRPRSVGRRDAVMRARPMMVEDLCGGLKNRSCSIIRLLILAIEASAPGLRLWRRYRAGGTSKCAPESAIERRFRLVAHIGCDVRHSLRCRCQRLGRQDDSRQPVKYAIGGTER